jgi:hypothetical protein
MCSIPPNVANGGWVAYPSKMEKCAILPDTNVALHFQPIDQIDWNALTGCGECIVVVAPILLRELEKQKTFNKSPALKARASRTIDLLVSKLDEPDPIPLRPGVTLAFMEHEPVIDFGVNNLVREVDDDHHIAAALAFQEATGLPTYVASNDGGIALKLRSRPIRSLRLPEEFRLPVEVDAEQKELRDAKLEIARLKAQKPKLALRFPDGRTLRTIKNAATIPVDKPTPAQIRAQHAPLPIPPVSKKRTEIGDIGRINIGGLQGFGTVARIERYNLQLLQYYADYEKFLVDYLAWIEVLRLTTTIRVDLVNEGSATATNIDVWLRFPAETKTMEADEWPAQPDEPEPPSKPGLMPDLGGAWGGGVRRPFRMPQINVHDGAVHCSEDGRSVHFSARSLKQGSVLAVDKFLLIRSAALTGKGVEVEVEITLHEGEPIRQTLALKFVEVEARKSDD